jgi:hypothetical protein
MNSKHDANEHNKKLEKLGTELSKIQYDFKIKNNPSEKYWLKRIEEFENYHKKVIEYFTHVYSLMNLVNEDQSGIFLLKISKLKQLGLKLLDAMKNIKENPSSVDLKDKQQSKWTIDLREQLIKSNEDCLNHEKHMNVFFRDFYDQYLKSD